MNSSKSKQGKQRRKKCNLRKKELKLVLQKRISKISSNNNNNQLKNLYPKCLKPLKINKRSYSNNQNNRKSKFKWR